jgi:hypothetical protein
MRWFLCGIIAAPDRGQLCFGSGGGCTGSDTIGSCEARFGLRLGGFPVEDHRSGVWEDDILTLYCGAIVDIGCERGGARQA